MLAAAHSMMTCGAACLRWNGAAACSSRIFFHANAQFEDQRRVSSGGSVGIFAGCGAARLLPAAAAAPIVDIGADRDDRCAGRQISPDGSITQQTISFRFCVKRSISPRPLSHSG